MLKSMKALAFRVPIGSGEEVVTPNVTNEYRDLLEGSLFIGLKQLPPELIQKTVKITGEELPRYDGAALTWLHVKQLFYAVSGCRDQGIECQLRALSESKAFPEVGFDSWIGRSARLMVEVKEYKNGSLKKIGEYLE